MKKKLALFIVCVLVLSLFAGCGKSKEISNESVFEVEGGFGSGDTDYRLLRPLNTENYYVFITDKSTEYFWDDDGAVYQFIADSYEKRGTVWFDFANKEDFYSRSAPNHWLGLGARVKVDFDKDAMSVFRPSELESFVDFNGKTISGYCVAKSLTVVGINSKTFLSDYAYKPVIYLYPEAETDVSVKLDYNGVLTSTYPSYNGGWNVTAHPDGTLISNIDGREYSYLFWEGQSNARYDMTKGFVVKGEDAAEFLQNTLSAMGLAPREYNEMIVFWLPQMEHNPYNLITFQKEAYTDGAALEIDPSPDSVLRVFMAWQSLDEPIDVEPPEIEPFERVGFTVVEWGGTEVR